MGRRPRSWLDGAARGGHIGETSKIEHYRWSTTAASRSLSRDQGSSQITTCLIVFSWGALTIIWRTCILGLLQVGLLLIRDLLPGCPLALFVCTLVLLQRARSPLPGQPARLQTPQWSRRRFPHFCRNLADQVCVSWRRDLLSRGRPPSHGVR